MMHVMVRIVYVMGDVWYIWYSVCSKSCSIVVSLTVKPWFTVTQTVDIVPNN